MFISLTLDYLCSALAAKMWQWLLSPTHSRHNGTPLWLKTKGVQYPRLCLGWCTAHDGLRVSSIACHAIAPDSNPGADAYPATGRSKRIKCPWLTQGWPKWRVEKTRVPARKGRWQNIKKVVRCSCLKNETDFIFLWLKFEVSWVGASARQSGANKLSITMDTGLEKKFSKECIKPRTIPLPPTHSLIPAEILRLKLSIAQTVIKYSHLH